MAYIKKNFSNKSAYKKQRAQRLKKQYNLTEEEFQKRLKSQDGKCAICRIYLGYAPNQRKPVVDHDHDTKIIRGILCNQCNVAIGLFGDSVQTTIRAVEYLAQYRQFDS